MESRAVKQVKHVRTSSTVAEIFDVKRQCRFGDLFGGSLKAKCSIARLSVHLLAGCIIR